MKSLNLYSGLLKKFVSKQMDKKDLPDFSGLVTPKLTIITPSYNQADFLERTILSVLNQGYPDLEYIVIDGGSTDHSVDILRKYEKHLAFWVSEKDKGQVDALNKALKRASGEWIAFQNSDDVYFPETFLNFAKAVSKSNGDILYGDLYLIDTQDQVLELLKTIPFSFYAQLWEGMQIHNQSLFFKRDLVENFGLFDETYHFAFDYEFITRYTSQPGVKALRVNGLAGALRIHESAKSSTIAEVGRKEHEKIRDEFARKLNLKVPTKIRYLCIRLRKVMYLIGSLDFAYLIHRLGFYSRR